MARDHKYLQAPSAVCITFSVLLLASYRVHPCHAYQSDKSKAKEKLVKGMFVFGSSVVDDGNNNYLFTSARANYKPYGIDFSFGPTGRFSNGKTVADAIGDLLALPFIPPFKDPQTKGDNIINGVNYGSGGSGILDDTGSMSGEVINLNGQIRNFMEVTLLELQYVLRNRSTQILDEYLFLVGAGNNDFLLSYLLQDESSRPSVTAFVKNLTSTFASQLQKLYNVGARKVAVLSVYPLGCSPVVRKIVSDSGQCVDKVHNMTQYFYEQSIEMVDDLNDNLPGSKFVVVNTHYIIMNIIENSVAKGFENAKDPCCELTELFGVGLACRGEGNVCEDRNKYVYFDGQHISEAVNSIIAKEAFSSENEDVVYPVNLKRLIEK